MKKNLFCVVIVMLLTTLSVWGQNKYKIGDLYEHGQIKGVVFYVDNSGRHGKIISVGQMQFLEDWATFKGFDWDYRYIKTGATDKYDGRKNHEVIKRIPEWREKFPIFKKCEDYGNGWYIPSKEELIEIMKQASKINYTLSMYNYNILSGNYYSSTEVDDSRVWNGWINGYSATTYKCYEVYKDEAIHTRFIHIF